MGIIQSDIDISVDQDDVILTVKLRWPAGSFLAVARQVHDALHPVREITPQKPSIEHIDQP